MHNFFHIFLSTNQTAQRVKNNKSSEINIIEKGAGHVNHKLEFYIDPITGQNNSFVKDFGGFITNRKLSPEKNTQTSIEIVEVVKLDNYFENGLRLPDFVKIDVEGFELSVLNGFKSTIEKAKPNLMIEIQADEEEIIKYFLDLKYTIKNDLGIFLPDYNSFLKNRTANIFFIR